jgi:hypothetical protein
MPLARAPPVATRHASVAPQYRRPDWLDTFARRAITAYIGVCEHVAQY